MKRWSIFAAALCAALGVLVSCASLGDPFLVVFSVPNKDKAIALTSAGIQVYRTDIVAKGDLAALAKARSLFEAALRYDPSNAEAPRYLVLVDDYRLREYEKTMDSAQALVKKRGRSEDDEYAMHVAIRRAVTLDPRSREAAAMLRETAPGRTALVDKYLARAENATSGLDPAASEAAKERAFIDAFRLVIRAREMEPRDVDAAKAYYDLKSEISAIVKRRIDSLSALYARNAFEDARAQISLLEELDRKIDGIFSEQLLDAKYDLYYKWASYHEGRKEWAQAASRATVAIGLRRSAEAQALLKRVTEVRAAEEKGVTFEAGIRNIDAYIAKGDLVSAQRVIVSLSKSATDPADKKLLEDRRRKVREALAAVYARGVQAYREERFKDAIAALETVTAIDAAYEQAADYLDKARAKQAVLDQY